MKLQPTDPAYPLEQGLNASLPSSPPLRDVIIAISRKTKQLNALDDRISNSICTLEDHFRAAGVERIYQCPAIGRIRPRMELLQREVLPPRERTTLEDVDVRRFRAQLCRRLCWLLGLSVAGIQAIRFLFVFLIMLAGCDGVFGLVHVADQVDASATYGDGKLIDDGSGVDARQYDAVAADAAPQGTGCAPTGNPGDSCTCVYDGTGCVSGYGCMWQYNNDNPPKQLGTCVQAASATIGQTCSVNTSTCGPEEWCAGNSSSSTTGTGNCEAVCNPRNGPCSMFHPCVPMPYCATPGDYTSCSPAVDSPVGYCA